MATGVPYAVPIYDPSSQASGAGTVDLPFVNLGAYTGLDVTAALQAASDAHPAGVLILLAAGSYTVTAGVVVNYSRINIKGAGPASTFLVFAPTANNQACLTYVSTPAGSLMNQNAIESLTIISADVTKAKVALRLTDVSFFRARDVQIGPNGAWNGTTGGTSIGVQFRGRDLSTFTDCEISCTDGIPVRMERNPNVALGGLEDADVCAFRDCHFVPGAGHWAFENEDGAQLTDLIISGGDCGAGSGLIKYVNTLSGSESYNVTIEKIRVEGPSGGYAIHFDAGANEGAHRGLICSGVSIGASPLGASNGFLLKGITSASIRDCRYVGTGVSLNATKVFSLVLDNVFELGASTRTMTAMRSLVAFERSFDGTAPGSTYEHWTSDNNSNVTPGGLVMRLGGQTTGTTGVWLSGGSGTIANGAQLAISLSSFKTAMIRVQARGATKAAIGIAAVTSLAPGVALTLISVASAGNDFTVGNVAGKFTVFDGGSGISTISLFNQTGESMDFGITIEAQAA